MKIKRIEAINWLKNLDKLKNLEGLKLNYAILKNAKKIEEEVRDLEKLFIPKNEFIEYWNKLEELKKKYCRKDENGNPVIINDSYRGLEDNKEYENEKNKLDNEYKEVIEERIKQVNEYNKFLEEDIDLDLIQIELNDLPNNVNLEQMVLLEKIIKNF